MVVRSRHAAVLKKGQWDSAFGRQMTVEKVLQYMTDHWNASQKRPPADMRYAQPEPKITKYFAKSLQKHRLANGIDGIFIPEFINPEIDDELQILTSRSRTDLTYYNEKVEPYIQIDLEFKKLKAYPGAKTSRNQYIKDGLIRFVNGLYAQSTQVGFMVGLIEKTEQVEEIVGGMKQSMQEKSTGQFVRILAKRDGMTIESTGKEFAPCEFETRHARDHVPNRDDVLIGHLFLVHEA